MPHSTQQVASYSSTANIPCEPRKKDGAAPPPRLPGRLAGVAGVEQASPGARSGHQGPRHPPLHHPLPPRRRPRRRHRRPARLVHVPARPPAGRVPVQQPHLPARQRLPRPGLPRARLRPRQAQGQDVHGVPVQPRHRRVRGRGPGAHEVRRQHHRRRPPGEPGERAGPGGVRAEQAPQVAAAWRLRRGRARGLRPRAAGASGFRAERPQQVPPLPPPRRVLRQHRRGHLRRRPVRGLRAAGEELHAGARLHAARRAGRARGAPGEARAPLRAVLRHAVAGQHADRVPGAGRDADAGRRHELDDERAELDGGPEAGDGVPGVRADGGGEGRGPQRAGGARRRVPDGEHRAGVRHGEEAARVRQAALLHPVRPLQFHQDRLLGLLLPFLWIINLYLY
ncbi:hypothetical protein VPH35_054571 [Triticum aestivum]